jgi:hydrogenase maturation protease
MQVAILGVGDPERGDLAAGILVAKALRERVPADVPVLVPARVDRGTELELDGVTHLLVVDCLDVGRAPGTIVLLDAAVLSPCMAMASVRDPALAHLLVLVGQGSDAPEEVALLGVQPGRTSGAGLSAEVEAALPELVEEGLRQLAAWTDRSSDALSAHRINLADC